MILQGYDNYIFDLYGTLIDLRTDEHCAQTWKKWCRWLDRRGIQHPHYIPFRREFFERDRALREQMLAEGVYECPEIDVVDIYREMFLSYGNKGITEETLKEASYAFRVASMEYIRLFPGVEDSLRQIRESGKHAYILSNAQATYTLPEILHFHLDELTDDYIMSSDYKCMKPDPAFFRELMNRHQMDPAKTVMLGDSASSDMAGAKKVGIDSIHLVGENHPSEFYLRGL